ncbi:hypothetical protein [Vibrio penaeicida]|nr:hypothetical protein [Vibrio penaeicida]
MIVNFEDLLSMNTKDYFEKYHSKLCDGVVVSRNTGKKATNYFLNKVVGKAEYNQNCYDYNLYYKNESIELLETYEINKKQCYKDRVIIDELNEKFRLLMFYKNFLKKKVNVFLDFYDIVEIDSKHVKLIKKEEA